jgi:hypothetical protein
VNALVCKGCGREVEACAFCDADDCEECICYRCVLYELVEARPPEPRTAD